MHVIPQGIFTEEFAALQEAARSEPLIVSLGVFDRRKGHHITLEAFAKVKANVPQAKLVIMGAAHDAHYYRLLTQRVTELALRECVDLRLNAPRAEVLETLRRARLFALHSQEESQGIALCEALAAGLPVVATQVGGIPFVVKDNISGLLVRFEDTEGFAAAIIRLLSDAGLYARMSAQAKAASRRFDWNSVAGDVVKLYH